MQRPAFLSFDSDSPTMVAPSRKILWHRQFSGQQLDDWGLSKVAAYRDIHFGKDSAEFMGESTRYQLLPDKGEGIVSRRLRLRVDPESEELNWLEAHQSRVETFLRSLEIVTAQETFGRYPHNHWIYARMQALAEQLVQNVGFRSDDESGSIGNRFPLKGDGGMAHVDRDRRGIVQQYFSFKVRPPEGLQGHQDKVDFMFSSPLLSVLKHMSIEAGEQGLCGDWWVNDYGNEGSTAHWDDSLGRTQVYLDAVDRLETVLQEIRLSLL
jgi:hypothetical protein